MTHRRQNRVLMTPLPNSMPTESRLARARQVTNANTDEASLDTITTVDKSEKPAEASKTDDATRAAHTDAILTIATPDAVAPVGNLRANACARPFKRQAARSARTGRDCHRRRACFEALDADVKSGTGKQVTLEKRAGTKNKPMRTCPLPKGRMTHRRWPRPAVQLHPDKPQAAASESDKQHVADARGESAPNSHFGIEASVSKSGDNNAASPTIATDTGAVSSAVPGSPTHAAPTVTVSAVTNAQPLPQPIAIPLAGVPIEIASKALAGKNRFEIRLDPPELGRIDVRLDVDRDGNVTSRLTVDRADTLDLLRARRLRPRARVAGCGAQDRRQWPAILAARSIHESAAAERRVGRHADCRKRRNAAVN